MTKTKRSPGSIIAEDLVPAVTALVDAHGAAQAAAQLGINIATVTRCMGGLLIRRGTAVQVRRALALPAADDAVVSIPDAKELASTVKALVQREGVNTAAAALGVDSGTVARCAAGRRLQRGTEIQVRLALAALQQSAETTAAVTATGP